ncbi:MAG TPA: NBR1-Ig-like domain-containing protein [Anaerolineales bacterium]|jgi:hypothetical protein|nr:NBR1-Ig-like domain-containing protein [Anaerolineales bacterium]
MMRQKITLAAVILLIVLLAGCNLPPSTPEQPEPLSAQTLAAQTIDAQRTQFASGSQPTQDVGQSPIPPADTLAPTNTSPPAATLPPTNTPVPSFTPTKTIPCNRAGFVKDVTVPDGKIYAPGTTFTKTWRLRNTGTCSWNGNYDLVFDSGNKMGAADVIDLTIGTVNPDDTVDISVNLTAPSASGDYRGDWLLRSDTNEVFGLGNSDEPFYVLIEVAKQASFEILSTNMYKCVGDDIAAFRVKNTGTDNLESAGGSLKNLSTDVVNTFGFSNTPFTENKDDCPILTISDIEPDDIYYLTYNLGSGSSGVKFRFEWKLCTQDGGGGDCDTQEASVQVP